MTPAEKFIYTAASIMNSLAIILLTVLVAIK